MSEREMLMSSKGSASVQPGRVSGSQLLVQAKQWAQDTGCIFSSFLLWELGGIKAAGSQMTSLVTQQLLCSAVKMTPMPQTSEQVDMSGVKQDLSHQIQPPPECPVLL